MRAPFHDLALVEDNNLIGMLHGRQAVRDHNTSTVLHQVVDRILHNTFRFGIEERSGFIQDQYRRVL